VIILWDPTPDALDRYRFVLGPDTQTLDTAVMVTRVLHDNLGIQQVVIGPDVLLEQACELAETTRLDRPELGVILLRPRVDVTTLSSALRSGIREVVAADDQSAIAEALRRSRELTARLLGHVGGATARESGEVITVFSAKGGVGKTTISTNIAVHLAATRAKTLLVDLDLAFGDVAISLQLRPTSSVYDAVAMRGHLDDEGLASLVTRYEPAGLDVICAPSDPGEADRIPVNVVSELLKVARTQYDYIVVDTPPSFTEHVLASCDISSKLVLIATLDIPAVKNLRVALDTLDMLGSPRDARVIVLNKADVKVGLRPEDVVTAIKSDIAVNIPNSRTVPASINRGVPIMLDDPRGAVSAAIRDLADTHLRAPRKDEAPAHGAHAVRRTLFRSRR
jgi:pilus assembly protein CpaE